jgi:peptidoglycan/LPS O-acetylase OafA/YrhL
MPNSTTALPRLNALTTLRFLAALHVVLFHMRVTGVLPGGPWWYQNLASVGYIGVNLFFVLSGFILVYTYANTTVSPRRFWQARFARIYPAYALSLLLEQATSRGGVRVDPHASAIVVSTGRVDLERGLLEFVGRRLLLCCLPVPPDME